MRRLLVTLAGALALVLMAAGPASASNPKVDEVTSAFDRSRADLARAVDLYGQGRKGPAYHAALAAYLDEFELVEPTLRVVDSDLTLEMEDRFALVRDAIERERGPSEVRRRTGDVLEGLTEFEVEVADPDLGAASLAFVQSFSIIFREGLEAVLLLGAMLGFLATAGDARHRKPVLIGVGGALAATAVTFVLLGLVLSVAPVQRELLEAVTTAVAVVVLFTISFWLLSRLEHRRWMEFVKSRLWGAMAAGSTLAIAAVGFTAVYREGFETVLFYQALLFFAQGVVEWVVIGFLAGCLALGAVAWAILKARKRLPLKVFMTAAVALVMLMSVGFTGNVVNQLQNLDHLPSTSLLGDVARLPLFVTQLTGIHPSLESLLAQGSLLLVYLLGFAALVVVSRRARRVRRRVEALGVEPA